MPPKFFMFPCCESSPGSGRLLLRVFGGRLFPFKGESSQPRWCFGKKRRCCHPSLPGCATAPGDLQARGLCCSKVITKPTPSFLPGPELCRLEMKEAKGFRHRVSDRCGGWDAAWRLRVCSRLCFSCCLKAPPRYNPTSR